MWCKVPYQALLVESAKMGRVRVPFPTFFREKAMPAQASQIFLRPVVRRVAIYLFLSSLAVVVINLSDLSQNSTAIFYIPVFIGIYILSRWIDSRLGENLPPLIDKTRESKTPQPKSSGFKP